MFCYGKYTWVFTKIRFVTGECTQCTSVYHVINLGLPVATGKSGYIAHVMVSFNGTELEYREGWFSISLSGEMLVLAVCRSEESSSQHTRKSELEERHYDSHGQKVRTRRAMGETQTLSIKLKRHNMPKT